MESNNTFPDLESLTPASVPVAPRSARSLPDWWAKGTEESREKWMWERASKDLFVQWQRYKLDCDWEEAEAYSRSPNCDPSKHTPTMSLLGSEIAPKSFNERLKGKEEVSESADDSGNPEDSRESEPSTEGTDRGANSKTSRGVWPKFPFLRVDQFDHSLMGWCRQNGVPFVASKAPVPKNPHRFSAVVRQQMEQRIVTSLRKEVGPGGAYEGYRVVILFPRKIEVAFYQRMMPGVTVVGYRKKFYGLDEVRGRVLYDTEIGPKDVFVCNDCYDLSPEQMWALLTKNGRWPKRLLYLSVYDFTLEGDWEDTDHQTAVFLHEFKVRKEPEREVKVLTGYQRGNPVFETTLVEAQQAARIVEGIARRYTGVLTGSQKTKRGMIEEALFVDFLSSPPSSENPGDGSYTHRFYPDWYTMRQQNLIECPGHCLRIHRDWVLGPKLLMICLYDVMPECPATHPEMDRFWFEASAVSPVPVFMIQKSSNLQGNMILPALLSALKPYVHNCNAADAGSLRNYMVNVKRVAYELYPLEKLKLDHMSAEFEEAVETTADLARIKHVFASTPTLGSGYKQAAVENRVFEIQDRTSVPYDVAYTMATFENRKTFVEVLVIGCEVLGKAWEWVRNKTIDWYARAKIFLGCTTNAKLDLFELLSEALQKTFVWEGLIRAPVSAVMKKVKQTQGFKNIEDWALAHPFVTKIVSAFTHYMAMLARVIAEELIKRIAFPIPIVLAGIEAFLVIYRASQRGDESGHIFAQWFLTALKHMVLVHMPLEAAVVFHFFHNVIIEAVIKWQNWCYADLLDAHAVPTARDTPQQREKMAKVVAKGDVPITILEDGVYVPLDERHLQAIPQQPDHPSGKIRLWEIDATQAFVRPSRGPIHTIGVVIDRFMKPVKPENEAVMEQDYKTFCDTFGLLVPSVSAQDRGEFSAYVEDQQWSRMKKESYYERMDLNANELKIDGPEHVEKVDEGLNGKNELESGSDAKTRPYVPVDHRSIYLQMWINMMKEGVQEPYIEDLDCGVQFRMQYFVKPTPQKLGEFLRSGEKSLTVLILIHGDDNIMIFRSVQRGKTVWRSSAFDMKSCDLSFAKIHQLLLRRWYVSKGLDPVVAEEMRVFGQSDRTATHKNVIFGLYEKIKMKIAISEQTPTGRSSTALDAAMGQMWPILGTIKSLQGFPEVSFGTFPGFIDQFLRLLAARAVSHGLTLEWEVTEASWGDLHTRSFLGGIFIEDCMVPEWVPLTVVKSLMIIPDPRKVFPNRNLTDAFHGVLYGSSINSQAYRNPLGKFIIEHNLRHLRQKRYDFRGVGAKDFQRVRDQMGWYKLSQIEDDMDFVSSMNEHYSCDSELFIRCLTEFSVLRGDARDLQEQFDDISYFIAEKGYFATDTNRYADLLFTPRWGEPEISSSMFVPLDLFSLWSGARNNFLEKQKTRYSNDMKTTTQIGSTSAFRPLTLVEKKKLATQKALAEAGALVRMEERPKLKKKKKKMQKKAATGAVTLSKKGRNKAGIRAVRNAVSGPTGASALTDLLTTPSSQLAALVAWAHTCYNPRTLDPCPVPASAIVGASAAKARIYQCVLRGVATANAEGFVYIGANASGWCSYPLLGGADANEDTQISTPSSANYYLITSGAQTTWPVHYTNKLWGTGVAPNNDPSSYPSSGIAESQGVIGVEYLNYPQNFIGESNVGTPDSIRTNVIGVELAVRPISTPLTTSGDLAVFNYRSIQNIFNIPSISGPAVGESFNNMLAQPLSELGRARAALADWPSDKWLKSVANPNTYTCFGQWAMLGQGATGVNTIGDSVGAPQVFAIASGCQAGQQLEFEVSYAVAAYGITSYQRVQFPDSYPSVSSDRLADMSANSPNMGTSMSQAGAVNHSGTAAVLKAEQAAGNPGAAPSMVKTLVSKLPAVVEATTGSSIGELVMDGIGAIMAML